MKTKSMFLAALLVVSAAFTAIGKDEPRATGMTVVTAKGSEVVKVFYRSENAGKVKLNIYNAENHVIFSDTRNIANNGFILPLNFAALPFGQYTIELTDAAGTIAEKFNYEPAGTINNIHVAKTGEEGKFLLSVSQNDGKNINVKIFDGFNNLVHNVSKQVSGDFAQVYSIKNFSGSVTFEVTNSTGQTTVVHF